MTIIGRSWAQNALRGLLCAVFAAMLAFAGAAAAQTTTAFGGGLGHDSDQPIEVAADSLEVRNAENSAVFRGNVRVRQGAVVMTATVLQVRYAQGGAEGAIDTLKATGDVIITNGADIAEAKAANYDVSSGKIILTGDVLLVQGPNVIKGDKLQIDLATGKATMSGRITLTVRPKQ